MKLPLPRLDIRLLFFIVFCLTIFFTIFIRDPDFFFHLKAGEDIWRSHTIPEVDHYSFTHEGQPWRAHEWLFETFIYLLFTLTGYLGIRLFIAVMGIGAIVISAAALSERRNSELPLIIYCAMLLTPFLTPRPHLFTFLFFALYLFALLRFKYRGEQRYLWGLPLLMVVWVNLHGAFLLGIVLIATFIGGELLTALWQQRLSIAFRQQRTLFIVLLAVSGASLINPWGWQQWLFPFELMGNTTMAMISEWQPTDFSELHSRLYLLALTLLLLLYLYAPRRPDLTELLVPWGLVAASLLSVRHMALALLAMLPFMLLKQRELFASTEWSGQRWVAGIRARLSGGRELGQSEQMLNGVLLVITVALFVLLYSHFHRNDTAKINERVPVGAADFIVSAGVEGRIFNTYHYGGYLIYRLAPQQKLFVDIRGDMFGAQVMDDYRTLYNALAGWQALLHDYAIDYMVIEHDAPLVGAALDSGLFATAYRDEQSVVLLRNEARYQPLIEGWRLSHPAAAEDGADSGAHRTTGTAAP